MPFPCMTWMLRCERHSGLWPLGFSITRNMRWCIQRRSAWGCHLGGRHLHYDVLPVDGHHWDWHRNWSNCRSGRGHLHGLTPRVHELQWPRLH